MNRLKRPEDQAFGTERVFGIVTSATDWIFLEYSDAGLKCTSKHPMHLFLTDDLESDIFRQQFNQILSTILWMLEEQLIDREAERLRAIEV